MKIVTQILALLLPALLLPQLAVADTSASVFLELPTCALNCLISSLGESTCATSNTTCMCLDTKLQDAATACTLANCTVLEALSAENITAVGCDRPVRDKNGVFRATTISLGTITGCFIVARFLYRIFVAGSIGADDWAALAAILVGIPSSVICVQGLAKNGLGRDIWTLPASEVYRFLEFFYVIEVEYFVNIAVLKLTLLFFYLRIFPTAGVRRIIWGTIGFTIVWGVVFLFIGIFQCRPISYYWTGWDGEHVGTCLNVNAIGWAHAAISIALDVWMLAVPLWQLRQLRLHWKKKAGVCLMFIVGTFVTIVSILRLHSLLNFANSTNPTWDNYEVINWSTIEVNVGIICACMPSVRLILVHFFPRALGSSSQRYYENYYNGGGNGNSNANNSRGAGGGNSRAQRSIPLVSTTSSSQKKGATTSTTITTINARDEEDDIGVADSRYRNNNSNNNTNTRPAGGTSGHAHNLSGGGGGILYSKSYAVEYGSDYHDEARLVYERGQAADRLSKSDLKSESRGSEGSL